MTIIFKDNSGKIVFTGNEHSTPEQLGKAFADSVDADKAIPLCSCGKPGEYKCPDCGLRVCGDHGHNGKWGDPDYCSTVRGRRGWRRLGEYDS